MCQGPGAKGQAWAWEGAHHHGLPTGRPRCKSALVLRVRAAGQTGRACVGALGARRGSPGKVHSRISRATASDRWERAGTGAGPHRQAQGCLRTVTSESQAAHLPPSRGKAPAL